MKDRPGESALKYCREPVRGQSQIAKKGLGFSGYSLNVRVPHFPIVVRLSRRGNGA